MYIVLACRIRGTTNFPQLLQIGRWITYLWHQRYLREIIFLPVHVLCFVWDWTGSKYSDLGRISSLPWQFVSYGVEPQYVFLSECFKLIFVWIGPLITIWGMKNFIEIFLYQKIGKIITWMVEYDLKNSADFCSIILNSNISDTLTNKIRIKRRRTEITLFTTRIKRLKNISSTKEFDRNT